MMQNQMEMEWKMKWKLGFIGMYIGLERDGTLLRLSPYNGE